MATYPIKMLKDEEDVPFVPLVETKAVVYADGSSLDDKLNSKLEITNIKEGDNIVITTEGNDCIISTAIPEGINVINNLTTEESGIGALDAYQGKMLKEMIPEIINNLTTVSSEKALSAYQGYLLDNKFNDYVSATDIESIINDVKLDMYPIGAIYISVNSTSPASFIGGNWIQLKDRFLVGAGDNFEAQEIGGETTHFHLQGATGAASGNTGAASGNTGASSGNTGSTTLTVEQIPSHAHAQTWLSSPNSGSIAGNGYFASGGGNSSWGYRFTGENTNATGGGQGHAHSLNSHTHSLNSHVHSLNNHTHTNPNTVAASNVPPYLAVYMWQRVP